MTVFLTGDIHSGLDLGKLSARDWPQGQLLTRDDYVIVLGDFGLPWTKPAHPDQAYWLDWLERSPWTTQFVDGNHENYSLLAAYPSEEWHGGRVQRITPHVLHLERGYVFSLMGMTFFVMGGAHSVELFERIPYKTWWPEEIPSQEERERALYSARQAGSVDFVLTHSPSARGVRRLCAAAGLDLPSIEIHEYMEWLDKLAGAFTWKRWYYGHMHMDLPDLEPMTPLFDDIVELPSGRVATCHQAPNRRRLVPTAFWRVRLDAIVNPTEQVPRSCIGRFGRLVELADAEFPNDSFRGWVFDMQMEKGPFGLAPATSQVRLKPVRTLYDFVQAPGGGSDCYLVVPNERGTFRLRVLGEREASVLDDAWVAAGYTPSAVDIEGVQGSVGAAAAADVRTFDVRDARGLCATDYLVRTGRNKG